MSRHLPEEEKSTLNFRYLGATVYCRTPWADGDYTTLRRRSMEIYFDNCATFIEAHEDLSDVFGLSDWDVSFVSRREDPDVDRLGFVVELPEDSDPQLVVDQILTKATEILESMADKYTNLSRKMRKTYE